MTVQDFLLLHTAVGTGANINFSGRINVLYNPINTTEGKIEAISISQNAANISPPLNTDNNINSVLEQVETVSFTFDNVSYVFTVTGRDFIEGTVPFFFFQVTSDTLVPNIFAAALDNPELNVLVTLQPFFNNSIFSTSDFNVLINNGDNLRKNSLRVVADRETGTVRPSNFTAILQQSASAAALQDSFYTDTGLINARYEGTTTNAVSFAGVPPSLSAREFEGEIHPIEVNRDYACGLGNNDRIIENLLHTGIGTTPAFTSQSTGAIVNPDTAQADDLIIGYAMFNSDTYESDFEVGDLLMFGSLSEIVRVEEHNPFTRKLKVVRGYLSTNAGTIASTTSITRIDRADVYREDQFNSALSSVGDSVIYVAEDNKLIYTDDFGTIFSSSLCPDALLLGIDNPNAQS
jgi:uncharacterized protein YerC